MNYLVHYGIPRMHWGIRRYQYEDGSLTPLGKARRRAERGDGETAAQKSLHTTGARKNLSSASLREGRMGEVSLSKAPRTESDVAAAGRKGEISLTRVPRTESDVAAAGRKGQAAMYKVERKPDERAIGKETFNTKEAKFQRNQNNSEETRKSSEQAEQPKKTNKQESVDTSKKTSSSDSKSATSAEKSGPKPLEGSAKDFAEAKIARAAQQGIQTHQNYRRNALEAEANSRARAEARTMTDAELKSYISRANLERDYARLSSESVNAGRDRVDAFLTAAGTALALTGSALTIAATIKQLKGN